MAKRWKPVVGETCWAQLWDDDVIDIRISEVLVKAINGVNITISEMKGPDFLSAPFVLFPTKSRAIKPLIRMFTANFEDRQDQIKEMQEECNKIRVCIDRMEKELAEE